VGKIDGGTNVRPGVGGAVGSSAGASGSTTAAGGASGVAPVAQMGGASGRLACATGPYPAVSEGRRITSAQYRNAIAAIFGGLVQPSSNYPGSYGAPITGFSTEASISTVGAQSVQQIMLAAEDVAQGVVAALPMLLPCSTTPSTANASCARTFVDTFARRAYRRTLAADEEAALLAFFNSSLQSDPSFADGIAMVTDVMLQEPQFLYVTEGAAPTARALTSSEVASRLSFMLWDSIPDDTLLMLADAGGLATPAAVLSQAQRLLASPKATTTIARFFREWTGAIEVGPTNKDTKAFPFLTDSLATSLNGSFDRFVGDELLNHGTIGGLLTTTDAWVDASMAGFFGVGAPAGGQWTKVALDPTKYAGIMTQPTLMASLAHPAVSSFVLRGKFVRKQLLCQPVGSPPANAQAVFASLSIPTDAPGKTVSAAILSVPACASCHGFLNPAGLAFENFDGIGRYRTTYETGAAIDPSGSLPGVGAAGETLTFADQRDLMRQLAAHSEVSDCFTRQLFRFGLSRLEGTGDGCALQQMDDAMTTSRGELLSALLVLTTSDAFRYKVDP
jgi:hypothetical protein